MRRPKLACAFILLAALSGCDPANDSQAPSQNLTSTGIVTSGSMNHGEYWFELDRVDQRFVFDTSATEDPAALIRALEVSNKSGRSVAVTFDLDSGSFNGSYDTPSYVVRSVDYRGKTLSGMTGQRKRGNSGSPAESELARGVALYNGGLMMEATPSLDKALSDKKLTTSLQGLALKTRGNATINSIWSQRDQLSEDDDKAFVRALADFRAWAALEPNNPDAQYAIGLLLRDLGAYEEAIETFQSIARRWPDEQFWPAIRIGATHRILGHYDNALAALDDLAAREGPQSGMAYYYHRGWTLLKMERYQEAIESLTQGLKDQPDYFWANVHRACAYAQLGQLTDALADERRALAELKGMSDHEIRTPALDHNQAWLNKVARQLEAAITKSDMAPMPAPCTGPWNRGDAMREKSHFLQN